MKLAVLISPLFQQAFAKLSASDLPLATAFKLKGIGRIIAEQIEQFEAVRKEALAKLADKDQDGNPVMANSSFKLSDDNFKLFMGKYNALINSDVEVGMLKVSELGKNISISANDLVYLEGLLEE